MGDPDDQDQDSRDEGDSDYDTAIDEMLSEAIIEDQDIE